MTLREINTRPGAPNPEDRPKVPDVGRFRGCLLGCVAGDVVGAWAERRPSAEARDYAKHFVHTFDFSKVGKHHHGMSFGQYTDDTQLTRELMLSLVDEGEWSPEGYADRIARIFARDGVVGYGGATQQAAVRLLDGVPWNEAGTPPPRAGNGAAMRAAPMGLFFWDDVDALVGAAEQQAIITHKAPVSVAGSVAVAVATAMCLNASRQTSGPHERGWWSWLERFVSRVDEDFALEIRDLSDLVFDLRKTNGRRPTEDEHEKALEWLLEADDTSWDGVSPWARTSVLWALYCLMRHPRSPWDAIELSVWAGGDTDTVAAMAGAMVGAHVGVEGFPPEVLEVVCPLVHDAKEPLWDWDKLSELVDHLHALCERRSGISQEH
jgi:ADP-ribosylglycohydrolase